MSERDKNGRFTTAPVGRPREEWRKDVQNALRQRYPGRRIADMLDEALELAVAQKSTKGIVSIAEYVRDTVDGTPIQRTENADSSFFQQIIAQLRQQNEDENTEIQRMMANGTE